MQSGAERAPKGVEPERKTFKRKFLHPDYFYNHAEPHRRRPTLVTFPCFITHTATFFGKAKKPRAAFREWLRMFEGDAWRRGSGTESADDWAKVLNRFSLIAQPSIDEEEQRQVATRSAPAHDVEFFIEVVPRNFPEIVARIEAHLEFFTLTLFKPLPAEFDVKTIYKDYYPQFVPDPRPNCKIPFHALYASLVKHFPESTFANFKGVVVDPKVFNLWGGPAPAFPRPGDSAPLSSDKAADTAIFLRKQKDAFAEGLFAASDEDVVACYFQRAQAIYVSALGAQKGPKSGDELRYLLIYNNEPLEQGGIYDSSADRYRLSRLVHRINTIGTLRLAALRDLRMLRRAGDELGRIETGIEFAAHDEAPRSRVRKLGSMIDRLERMARDYVREGTPLFYRTARASLYFDQMKTLLKDLGSDPIPEWQSYNQFLSRRLFAQHEFTATLGNRMSELWALARSRAEVAEAKSLGWLQWAARMASLILLPLAVADMLRDRTSVRTIVADLLFRVGIDVRLDAMHAWAWAKPYVPSWWQHPEIQEFWLIYALTFCGWLTLIWFFGRPRE